jgi:hypothetical protein
MSDYNWCLGPYCHEKQTQDRVRGVKGNKVLRTRKIALVSKETKSKWNYFCSQRCLDDYINKYLTTICKLSTETRAARNSG